jgi:hypothetical protein
MGYSCVLLTVQIVRTIKRRRKGRRWRSRRKNDEEEKAD